MKSVRFMLSAAIMVVLGAGLVTAAVTATAHGPHYRLLPRESYNPLVLRHSVLNYVAPKGLRLPAHVAATGSSDQAVSDHNLVCTEPNQITNFQYYSLGSTVAGFGYNDTIRRCDVPRLYRANYVSMTYGDCQPPKPGSGDDGSCAPPLEIQSWPACERNASMDSSSLPGSNSSEVQWTRVRGVPAAIFASDGHVELYTAKTTVVIYGGTLDRVLAAAQSVRSMGQRSLYSAQAHLDDASVTADITPPDSSAMTGTLSCHAQ